MNTTHTYRNYTPPDPSPQCSIQFTIPHDLDPPVFLYYRLTNFYQNHRRYVKSLDTNQLKGDAVPSKTIDKSNCDPLRLDDQRKPYYPCGLIANSLFNDSFAKPLLLNVEGKAQMNETYNMTNKGIAWDSDKALYGQTKYKPADIAVPPNWKKQYPEEGYSDQYPPPNLEDFEELHVWMRSAGLPAFSKLAMRNDKEKMACGTYRLDITDSGFFLSNILIMLTSARFQRYDLRGNQVHPYFHQDCHGWQESLLGYCIPRSWGYLYPAWRIVYSYSSDQTAVRYILVWEQYSADIFAIGNSVITLTLRGTMISQARRLRPAFHDPATTLRNDEIMHSLFLSHLFC